jgi:hypothetical protein
MHDRPSWQLWQLDTDDPFDDPAPFMFPVCPDCGQVQCPTLL